MRDRALWLLLAIAMAADCMFVVYFFWSDV